MSNFNLAPIPEVKGPLSFKKLVIDGYCPFDAFCEEIKREGNLSKQLIGAVNTMTQVANLQRLPKEKFRDITLLKANVKEYEIKKGDLRFYVIKEDGHIVVMGGKKGTQKEDMKRFRNLKERYLQSKQ